MAAPTRHVLEGVPPTYFEGGDSGRKCGNPESLALPSCLRAWLEFMGDGYGCRYRRKTTKEWRPDCAYAYLAGLTGGCFSLGWELPEGLGGLSSPLLMAEDPVAPFHRVLDGIGYEHEVLLAPELVRTASGREPGPSAAPWEEAGVRARIMESLRAGRPALGLGLVGPPEACLITGYDEGGEVLAGWSLFQKSPEFAEDLELEPCGYFRVRDWFAKLHGLVVIGERKEKPPAREVHRRALEWAVQLLRTPEVHGRPSGIAAYDAWRAALRDHNSYADLDEAGLRRQWHLHNDMTGFLAGARHDAFCFLRQLIAYSPELESDLEPAARSCGIQHDLMWGVWEYLRSWDPGEHHQRLTDGWLRERMHMLVHLARREDDWAAGHIERALGKEW